MVEAIKDPKARGSKIIVLNSAKSLAGVLLRFGCESDWHAEVDARKELPCYISARKDLICEPERQPVCEEQDKERITNCPKSYLLRTRPTPYIERVPG